MVIQIPIVRSQTMLLNYQFHRDSGQNLFNIFYFLNRCIFSLMRCEKIKLNVIVFTSYASYWKGTVILGDGIEFLNDLILVLSYRLIKTITNQIKLSSIRHYIFKQINIEIIKGVC